MSDCEHEHGHADPEHEMVLEHMSAAVAEAFNDAADLLIQRNSEKPRTTASEYIFALIVQRLVVEGADTESRKALLGLAPILTQVINSVMDDVNRRYSSSVVEEVLARAQKETRQ